MSNTNGFDDVSAPPVDEAESERLNQFFEDAFHQRLRQGPIEQSYLGIKDDYEKWDDLSDAAAIERFNTITQDLNTMRKTFNYETLNKLAKLNYRLFEFEGEMALARHPYRFHDYPVNQLSGWQSEIPSFLINIHSITSESDALAYITRLRGIRKLVGQIIESLETRAKMGITAPKFVYPHVIDDC